MTIAIGCAGAPPRMSRDRALAQVDFLEEDILLHSAPPSAKAMRKWQTAAPNGSFTLFAPESLWTSIDPASEERFRAALESLRVTAVLYQPPRGHAPSATNRERLVRAISESSLTEVLAKVPAVLVPRGLWDLDVTSAVARELDAMVAFDPLVNDPLEEIPARLAEAFERETAYLRPGRTATTRRRLDSYELETLADIAANLSTTWVSFTHGERLRDGKALRALVSELVTS